MLKPRISGEKVKAVFEPEKFRLQLVPLLIEMEALLPGLDATGLSRILRRYPKQGKGYFSKSDLIAAYRYFAGSHGLKPYNPGFADALKMKPVRTISGVTPVTVLTKPYPCPGKCIFCPNDIRMPKSYIASEPGAQRAERNYFDPYLQTYNRLLAYQQIGHSVDKAELIVLGGTWSFYPLPYKLWYIKRLFEALNDFGDGIDARAQILPSIDTAAAPASAPKVNLSTAQKYYYNQAITQRYHDQEQQKQTSRPEAATWEELEREHARNETNPVRCVGLVLETRPDFIDEAEVVTLRRLGCTKTQIGIQSLQDQVLSLNQRGHDVAATSRAFALLRQAGYKIHAHWMPNLYGSGPEKDKQDYRKLFTDPDFLPDELKIYPCSLIDHTGLMEMYKQGKWQPYTQAQLLEVMAYCLTHTPLYCRLTRIVRDIPGQEIVAGNKKTNFRQLAEDEVRRSDLPMLDIRAREIKHLKVAKADLALQITEYSTSVSAEQFLEYRTRDNHIAAFLRLSLPLKPGFIPELNQSAIIREVHVYGQSLSLGQIRAGKAQHSGLGKKLIAKAQTIARLRGFSDLAVISAVGTREYYRKLGFTDGALYQHFKL